MNANLDSLDYQREHYQYRVGYSPNPHNDNFNNQNHAYKQFYKQQLDDLVKQKQQQRRMHKQKEAKQRNIYNQRISSSVEAEKLKDLSYKNYYQMLLNNQMNMSKAYVSPFHEREVEKDRHVSEGIEEEKRRSQLWQELEQKRYDEVKKNYRQNLAAQINQKYNKNAVQIEHKVKQQIDYTKNTYTPQELAKFERQRKLIEMQKYKDDLDKTSVSVGSRNRSMTTSPIIKNDFNVLRIEDRHNPMVNPMPYNIQNPYILKEMKRKDFETDIQANKQSY